MAAAATAALERVPYSVAGMVVANGVAADALRDAVDLIAVAATGMLSSLFHRSRCVYPPRQGLIRRGPGWIRQAIRRDACLWLARSRAERRAARTGAGFQS